ncbi:hypothetical protein BH20ACT24_BH20ACT24_10740 [soil metagenome]
MDSRSGTARNPLVAGVLAVLLSVGTLTLAGSGLAPASAPGSEPLTPTTSQVEQTLSSLPLSFIENRGQMDPLVSYYVQGSTTTVYFTPGGVTFSMNGGGSEEASLLGLPGDRTLPAGWARQALEGTATERYTLKLDFVGANPKVSPIAQGRAPGVVSYFTGPQESWFTGLPTFKQVVYPELWPGIDLVYSGTGSSLKYTFHVDAGADPSRIRLAYRGASDLQLNAEGELQVSTPTTVLTEQAPYTYQMIDGERAQVASGYVIGSGGSDFGFHLGDYDPTRPLVIDPVVVVYAGYIGGTQLDVAPDVAVDGAGSAYVSGYTASNQNSFPVKVGPDLTFNGDLYDAFVAKVDPSGESLVYAGFIGGTDSDRGFGIAVDGPGSAYVTGYTTSSEESFPVAVGPDLTHNGYLDAFVAKVEPSGESLAYAGYIGGVSLEEGWDIAVDGAGSAYVIGDTISSEEESFPVVVGPDLTHNGGNDAFVAKVAPSGAALVYAGYIGGGRLDAANGVAVDGAGSAYVAGYTASGQRGFPVEVGPDLTHNGGNDAFVAKVAPSGASLVFAGYIGGAQLDYGEGVAVDRAGSAYVTGETEGGEGFPVAVGPDLTFNGNTDVFVAKVAPSGRSLAYAGYIGGKSLDDGRGIAVDRAGSAYVTGLTRSSEDTFPVTGGPDLSYNGSEDAFVAKVMSSGESLLYAGYIGGSSFDYGIAVAVDRAGWAYVIGYTASSEDEGFPVEVGPDLTFNGGTYDPFVVKIGRR